MKEDNILIIGAGLCGTLLAIRLAQRGLRVKLYEKRPDMRRHAISAGRSINLALSKRGLLALQRVGLEEQVLQACIPMRGRMVHPLGGEAFFSPYSGRPQDYINSVSRGGLNSLLLDEAEALGIPIYFHTACLEVDLQQAEARFENRQTGRQWSERGQVIIGADGAGSAVRRSLMAHSPDLLFNYSQHFLRHGYKELSILPHEQKGWRIEQHALHIWPRDQFMIIALPNLDGSFTVTMFHPFEGEMGFRQLNTPERLRQFFEQYFPELIALMPHYREEFFQNPTGSLGTIKCFPWQAYGRVLIMGDAAHAIVPFYGQGMNAAFEDVRVFDDLLEECGPKWEEVFTRFEVSRAPNTDAIADLALDNFIEMRDRVDDEDFIRKRRLERWLEQQFPDYYSKYSLVTFRPDLPYREAMRLGRRQDELLLELCSQQAPEEMDLQAVHAQLMQLQQA
ncbi:MAG: FAD-dependent monooxygenase [Bacteroidetes bacterium]|nr:MAG: FAD-dependent monooxygenase [Bacteroidota bacterium]